ncbi:MAG: CDP-glycerol glycerophosphotransferase family protein [Acidobacteriota bacterium]|nr:CDP-glycerol glycerophosphotransferase family protein [Acidobacteriota bacterium]
MIRQDDSSRAVVRQEYDPDVSLIENPVVSCIVPMYNVREDVAECIDSIINQTLKDLQIILVDDGSTDDTGDIAREFALRYPNVEYHRKPNGGLGHARNYGVRYARGEWLMFPDSDDIIVEDALEGMVDLGERHHSDMVIGDAVRFDTKREFSSGLHRRAFGNMREVSHITQNHDLLYDTTAWNKLFRRDFFVRHGFAWVEGRLYEDIPVTIPAHFEANNVAFLDKVVYRWRVRDGQSASITQKRMEPTNFRDRFHAVVEVDRFFDENVTDESLIVDKDIKWLTLDLKMYIDVFPEASEEFQDEVMDTVAHYIQRIRPEAFARVPAATRIKYRFIANHDKQQLLSFLQYEKVALDTLKVRRKHGRMFGKYPFDGLSEADFDMTDELRSFCLLTEVSHASFAHDLLTLEIVALIPQISQKRVSLAARIESADGTSVADLAVERNKVRRRIEIRNNLEFKKVLVKNQPVREFTLTVPLEILKDLEPGDYGVMLDYTDADLQCVPTRLGGPKPGVDPRPFAHALGDKIISISYDLSWRLTLIVRSVESELSSIECRGDSFEVVFGDGSSRELPIPSDDRENDRGIVHEDIPCALTHPLFFVRKGAYRYDLTNHARVVVPEDLMLPNEVGQRVVPVPGSDHEVIHERDELWKASADKRGHLRLERYDPGIVMRSCTIEGQRITLSLDFPYDRKVRDARLALVGSRFGAEIDVALAPAVAEAPVTRWTATVDLGDRETVSLLRDDSYQLIADVVLEDGTRVKCNTYSSADQDDLVDEFKVDGYTYTFDRRSDRLWLAVTGDKKFYEGRLRQQVVERVIYPAMRLLPIKSNLVMFESYWGMSAGCNPKAIYDYIDQHHPEYDCVWSVRDERIPVGGRAKVVEQDSLPFFYALARCRYLVNNVNFCDQYEKRPGQIEVQTMHGTPLKTLGLDVKDEFPDEKTKEDFLRRCGRWDYLIVQSPRVEQITRSCYAYTKEYLRTGYPRNDELLKRNTPEVQRQIKGRLGVDPDSKLVIYMPTWRVHGRFDLELDFARMAKQLGEGYTFGLRRHYFAVPGFTRRDLMGPALDFTYERSIDDLYLAADVIITDYSSVMFDYALLDRPILFYVYDLEAYRDELRGFNVDLESESPGPLLRTSDEVVEALRDLDHVRQEWGDAFARFKDSFLAYETDHSTEDVFSQVFRG